MPASYSAKWRSSGPLRGADVDWIGVPGFSGAADFGAEATSCAAVLADARQGRQIEPVPPSTIAAERVTAQDLRLSGMACLIRDFICFTPSSRMLHWLSSLRFASLVGVESVVASCFFEFDRLPTRTRSPNCCGQNCGVVAQDSPEKGDAPAEL